MLGGVEHFLDAPERLVGSARDEGGGVVAAVEISLDGRAWRVDRIVGSKLGSLCDSSRNEAHLEPIIFLFQAADAAGLAHGHVDVRAQRIRAGRLRGRADRREGGVLRGAWLPHGARARGR